MSNLIPYLLNSAVSTESPIEDVFEHEFNKYAKNGYCLIRQCEFSTQLGKFRVDFTLSVDDYLVGFECDGREYHELWHDEIRDAVLLGEKHLGTIYHFPGKALWFEPAYAIEFIARRDNFFLDRTLKVVQRRIESNPVYPPCSDGSPFLCMRRWSRINQDSSKRCYWREIYQKMLNWKCDNIGEYKQLASSRWQLIELLDQTGIHVAEC
jgi:hypothetical protein